MSLISFIFNKLIHKLIRQLIRFYQYFISPWLGSNCRFYPTCSSYANQAIDKHGVFYGSWLTFWRLCRCHPYSNSDYYDPVPHKDDDSEC